MGDVVRSVAVLGLVILALWGVGRLFTNTPADPVKAIDYARIVRSARPAADFALLAPPSLPTGWKATSARFEPNSWHLGVLTADNDYIGVEQVKVSIPQAVGEFAKDSRSAGSATIAGKIWRARKGPGDDITFVRAEAGLTTLINGSAPRQVIEDYVASLSAS